MSTDTIPAASNRSITKRILLASAAFLSVIVILIAGSVFFLPAIISTEWFRDFAETRVSETLHRPVQIKRVSWSWKGEIEIEGVLIKDLPVFSDEPICSISKAAIQLDLKKILQRRLIVNLTVSDITMELIRNHNGQTNLEKFLFPLTRSAPAGPEQPPRSSENR
ncbi:MAG: AsmA family protein, partial [Desulfobacterales bacterium]